MSFVHAIFLGTALATSPAFAAGAAQGAISKLPAEAVQGQVHYVSGGIGQDEARAFRKAEHLYPLTLEFANKAKPHDEFTADVRVVIRNAKGKSVLDTVSGGPFLLAKLPIGRYDVTATQGGKAIEHHATIVKSRPTHVAFLWDLGNLSTVKPKPAG